MELFFYFFSFFILFSSVLAVLSNNSVYAVLYLIFAFLNAGGLFILLKAEFLAMVLVIVYVGAIAVLFLFTVMMIGDKDDGEEGRIFNINFFTSLFFSSFLGVILFKSLYKMISNRDFKQQYIISIKEIGRVFYTEYVYLFQISGIILLFSMIATISLALHHKKNIKRQNIYAQIERSSKLDMIDVPSKSGVEF